MEREWEMRRRATDFLGNSFQPSHHKELCNPNYTVLRVC